jgi:hypothetical protein
MDAWEGGPVKGKPMNSYSLRRIFRRVSKNVQGMESLINFLFLVHIAYPLR